jgi:hypothetical protein
MTKALTPPTWDDLSPGEKQAWLQHESGHSHDSKPIIDNNSVECEGLGIENMHKIAAAGGGMCASRK